MSNTNTPISLSVGLPAGTSAQSAARSAAQSAAQSAATPGTIRQRPSTTSAQKPKRDPARCSVQTAAPSAASNAAPGPSLLRSMFQCNFCRIDMNRLPFLRLRLLDQLLACCGLPIYQCPHCFGCARKPWIPRWLRGGQQRKANAILTTSRDADEDVTDGDCEPVTIPLSVPLTSSEPVPTQAPIPTPNQTATSQQRSLLQETLPAAFPALPSTATASSDGRAEHDCCPAASHPMDAVAQAVTAH